jgi:3-deoxy-D-manno-octulosonate 8-phosphate phosphatase (KDO 8-P phosphatase)
LGNIQVTAAAGDIPWGKVKLLGLDIDGVLTDGGVTWHQDGTVSRRFDIKDGFGLVRFQESGGVVAVISSSTSQVGVERLTALGIQHVFTGVPDKAVQLTELMTQLDIDAEHVAFVGDDVPDLGCFDVVGISVAPADAATEVVARAHYVTAAAGGKGAVREVCDAIWEQATR